MRTGVLLCLSLLAFSPVAAGGRKSEVDENMASIRVLTDSEAVLALREYPRLRFRPASQIRSSLLQHLFPGTAFYTAIYRRGRPPSPLFLAVSGDSLLTMPDDFNRLLRMYNMKVTDRNVVELARAFVIIAIADEPIHFETGDPGWRQSFPAITSLTGEGKGPYDKRRASQVSVEMECRMGDGEVQTWQFYDSRNRAVRKGEWVRTGEFAMVRLAIDGKPEREYRLQWQLWSIPDDAP